MIETKKSEKKPVALPALTPEVEKLRQEKARSLRLKKLGRHPAIKSALAERDTLRHEHKLALDALAALNNELTTTREKLQSLGDELTTSQAALAAAVEQNTALTAECQKLTAELATLKAAAQTPAPKKPAK